ncbi:substrate-binding domain-containing protein [Pseudobutyrivibrio xylanivorans]|uniref:Substrate-binding domain-containing protein n=1 Tax=Pseudobutyrivibrio xylanivorans TaxID=185007 RepID=A0A5P6VPY6_PSEXY|nr:substrate-binding domain-containing protein [Pseudobutyrivibrio xylanivorans]QFJ54637.1 substrate-binding domain-containing protein [Pseudobutyrivibrio xylanivorans]
MKANGNYKKLLVILLTVILTAGVILAGCGSSSGGGGSAGGKKFLYSGPPSDTFKQLLMDNIAAAGSAAGVTVDFGEPCESVKAQVDQFKQAVSAGYDAIICLPVDRSTALQLETVAGDLPIIYVNACPDEQFLKENKYIAVSSYEMNAGEYQAEYVWNKLGKPSSMNIVILRGELTHNASVQRSVSVKNWLRKNGVELNVVFDDTANWSVDEAADVMNLVMKIGQPFDCVFCNNDDMAIGACHALKAKGYDLNKVPVVGVDATTAGCQSIVDGEMQFTVYQSAKGQGEKAIETAIALTTKGSADGIEGLSEDGFYVWVPFEKVDATNVKDYM